MHCPANAPSPEGSCKTKHLEFYFLVLRWAGSFLVRTDGAWPWNGLCHTFATARSGPAHGLHKVPNMGNTFGPKGFSSGSSTRSPDRSTENIIALDTPQTQQHPLDLPRRGLAGDKTCNVVTSAGSKPLKNQTEFLVGTDIVRVQFATIMLDHSLRFQPQIN